MRDMIQKVFGKRPQRDVLVFLTLLVRGELTMNDVPSELQEWFWHIDENIVEVQNYSTEEDVIDELLTMALTKEGNADPRAIIERRFPEEDLTD